MKLALKYISILAIMLLAYSCESDENGRMPDEMEEVCFPYIQLDAETSSPFLVVNNPSAYVLNGTVDAIFKDIPFDKLRLVVAYSGNYATPSTLVDNITSLPYDVSITGTDLINAIDEISDSTDVTEDDDFQLYVIPMVNGVEYPPYQVLDGKAYHTVSSSIYNDLLAFTGSNAAEVNITVMMVCDLINGVDDLVGSWDGSDAWEYSGSGITTVANGTDALVVSGMGEDFIADPSFWGEPVISGGSFNMNINSNGTLEIPRQYIFTTEYAGDPYDYEIQGSGFWKNCGTSPVLEISYDIYYPGDAVGLAGSYPDYMYEGNSYLYTEITLQ
jgi:hypothetical protein